MNVGPVIENERATRLLDMETAQTVAFVGEHVRIRQVAQVVRALPHIDKMRETEDQLQQARRIAFQRAGIMQHHANSAHGIRLQEVDQCFKARFFVEPQGGKIAIENQDMVLCPTKNRVVALPIPGFSGKQRVGRAHG